MKLSDQIYKQYEDAKDPFMRAVFLTWHDTATNMEQTLESRAIEITNSAKRNLELLRNIKQINKQPCPCGGPHND